MNEDTRFDVVMDRANDSAEKFAKTIRDTLDAFEIFAKQGYNEQDIAYLADAALVTSNVGELEAGQAAEYLTSTMTQLKLETKDAMSVIDAWNNISNNHATTIEKLAQGHSKAASTASAWGLDMHELNAIIGTVTASTKQSGNEVGNFVKNVLPRLTSAPATKALDMVGVSLTDESGNIKDAMQVYEEVGREFVKLDKLNKNIVAEGLAGKHHISRMTALLSNISMYRDILDDSMSSQGSSLKENETYMQSLQARIDRTRQSAENLALQVGESFLTESFIQFLNGVTELTSGMAEMTKTAGFLAPALGTVATVSLLMSSNFKRAIRHSNTFGASLQRVAFSANAAKIALRTLGAATVLGAVFAGVGFALEKLIGKLGEAREAKEELERKNRQLTESFKENEKDVKRLAEEYENYTNKINDGDYNNKDLEEFNRIKQELATLMPELITGEDQYGNKIIESSERVKAKIALLEKQLKVQNDLDAKQRKEDAETNYDTALESLDEADKKADKVLSKLNTNLGARFPTDLIRNYEDLSNAIEELENKKSTSGLNGGEERRLSILKEAAEDYGDELINLDGAKSTFQSSLMELIDSTVGAEKQFSDATKSMMNDFTLFTVVSEEDADKINNTFGHLFDKLKNDSSFKNILNDYGKAMDAYNKKLSSGATEEELKKFRDKAIKAYEAVKNGLLDIAKSEGLGEGTINQLSAQMDVGANSALSLEGALEALSKSTGMTKDELMANLMLVPEVAGEFDGLSGSVDGASDSADRAKMSFEELYETISNNSNPTLQDYMDLTDKASEELDLLAKANKELAEDGRLSKDTMDEMIGTFDDFISETDLSIDKIYDYITASKDKKDKSIEHVVTETKEKIQQSKDYIAQLDKEIEAMKTIADFRIKQMSAQVIKNRASLYDGMSQEEFNRITAQTDGLIKAINEYRTNLSDLETKRSTEKKSLAESEEAVIYVEEAYNALTESYNENSEATDKNNKSKKDQIYLTDQHTKALDKLNREIDKQNKKQQDLVKGSKAWIESQKKEIDLLKQKRDEIGKQIKDYESLQASGQLYQSGIVDASSANNPYDLTSGSFNGKQDFINKTITGAKRAASSLDIPFEAILTQWALESNWGASDLASRGTNLAGIKSSSKGKDFTTGAYAGYDNLGKFVDDYIRVMNLSYYDNVRGSKTTSEAITNLHKSPWAEDPKYESSLTTTLDTVNSLLKNVSASNASTSSPKTENINVSHYVKGDVDKLNPEMLRRLVDAAVAEGKVINVSDGYRSLEEQKKTYAKYGSSRAAKPGNSAHGYGIAIDIMDEWAKNKPSEWWEQFLLHKPLEKGLGKTQPENWHIEPLETKTSGRGAEPFKQVSAQMQNAYNQGSNRDAQYLQTFDQQGNHLEGLRDQFNDANTEILRQQAELYDGFIEQDRNAIESYDRKIQEYQKIVDENPFGSRERDQALNEINYQNSLKDKKLNDIQYRASVYKNSPEITEGARQGFKILEEEIRLERQAIEQAMSEISLQRVENNRAYYEKEREGVDRSLQRGEHMLQNYNEFSQEYRDELAQQNEHLEYKKKLLHEEAEGIREALKNDSLTAVAKQELQTELSELSLSWHDANNQIKDYNNQIEDSHTGQFQDNLDAMGRRLARNSNLMEMLTDDTDAYNEAVADSIKVYNHQDKMYKDEAKRIEENIAKRKEQGKSYDDLSKKLSQNKLDMMANQQELKNFLKSDADRILENTTEKINDKIAELTEEQAKSYSDLAETIDDVLTESEKRIQEFNDNISTIDYDMSLLNPSDYDDKISLLSNAMDENQSKANALVTEFKRLSEVTVYSEEDADNLRQRLQQLKDELRSTNQETINYIKSLEQAQFDQITTSANIAQDEIDRLTNRLNMNRQLLEGGMLSGTELSMDFTMPTGNVLDLSSMVNNTLEDVQDIEVKFDESLQNQLKSAERHHENMLDEIDNYFNILLGETDSVEAKLSQSTKDHLTDIEKQTDISLTKQFSEYQSFYSNLNSLVNSSMRSASQTQQSYLQQMAQNINAFNSNLKIDTPPVNSGTGGGGGGNNNSPNIKNVNGIGNVVTSPNGGVTVNTKSGTYDNETGSYKIKNHKTGKVTTGKADSLDDFQDAYSKAKDGTPKQGLEYEGLAQVNEEGKELVILPNGEIKLTSNSDKHDPKFMYLPKGTHVIPNKETNDILNNRSYANGTDGYMDKLLELILNENPEPLRTSKVIRDHTRGTDLNTNYKDYVYDDWEEDGRTESSWIPMAKYENGKLAHFVDRMNIEDVDMIYEMLKVGYQFVDEDMLMLFTEGLKNAQKETKNKVEEQFNQLENIIKSSEFEFYDSTDGFRKSLKEFNEGTLQNLNDNIDNQRANGSEEDVLKAVQARDEAVNKKSFEVGLQLQDESYKIAEKTKKELEDILETEDLTEDMVITYQKAIEEQQNIMDNSILNRKQIIREYYDYEQSLRDKDLQKFTDTQDDIQHQLDLASIENEDNLTEQIKLNIELFKLEKDKLDELIAQKMDIQQQMQLLEVGSYEWSLLNEKAKEYSEWIEDSNIKIREGIELVKEQNEERANKNFERGLTHFDNEKQILDFYNYFIEDDDIVAKTENINSQLDNLFKRRQYIQDKISNIHYEFPTISSEDLEKIMNGEYSNEDLSKIFGLTADQIENLTSVTGEWMTALMDTEKEIHDLHKTQKSLAREQLSTISNVEQKIIQMIQKRVEKQKEALDNELNDYREFMDEKIRILNDTYDEDNYQKDLAKEQEELVKLQSERNKWLLDDTLAGRNKQRELSQKIEEQEEKIKEMMRKRSLDNQIKNINNLVEEEEKRAEKEHEKLDEKLEAENLYAEASKAIQTGRMDYFVETTKGAIDIVDLSLREAFENFEDKYGEGFSIAGQKIKDDFISQIEKAIESIKELDSLMDTINDDTTPSPTNPTEVIDTRPEHVKRFKGDMVGANKQFKVNFSKEVDANTLDDIFVIDSQGNKTKLNATVAENGKSVIVNHMEGGYDPNEIYNLAIKGVKSIYGDELNSGAGMEFGINPNKIEEQLHQFNTGGYTGNSQGIAMLHEKEIVLNKTDTKNLLDTIKLNRDMLPKLQMPNFSNLIKGIKQTVQPVQLSVDNLIRIDGNADKSIIPDLERAANYTLDKLKREFGRNGFRR